MKKLTIAGIICASAIVLLEVIFLLIPQTTAENDWQAQYDLGMRYLAEGNYEEAIPAFWEAIEINPREPQAYLMLASAYNYIGEPELAAEILQQGLEATNGNEDIRAQLDALAQGDGTGKTDVTAPMPSTFVSGTDVAETVENSNLVTEAYSHDCTYTAEMYNYETGKSEETQITCTFRIPQINLPGSDVEQINEEMYNTLYSIIEDSVEEISEYGRPFLSKGISYRWAVNGDVLSLVVLNSSDPEYGAGSEYMVYNIAISSGTMMSSAAVVEAAGMTESAYYEKAKQVLGSSFWENWDPSNVNFGNQSFVSFFNEQLSRTISDENIAQSYPYINENGQLCLVAKKYSLAAADYYWCDLNMVDFVLISYYADEAGRISHTINISEEEAYGIACEYWDFTEGKKDEESGFELYLVYDGLLEEADGNHYYAYRLRWWVPENNMMSTVDYLYINAKTGEYRDSL